jgi:3-methyl-2-oxobutanoate hydroxymethyltransferase
MSSHETEASNSISRPSAVNLKLLQQMHERHEPITMLTAYDATFAAEADRAGLDCLLVGDSLGMVCEGRSSTLGVSMQTMCDHTASVARGLAKSKNGAWLIADMPFGSYQEGPEQAFRNAALLMQAGAQMVKLEGGKWTPETVSFLVKRGVPVCAHLGLTPQSVSALGGYRVQAREDEEAVQLMKDAHDLQDAGAQLLVLELIPHALARKVTQALKTCATIGIGAGNGTAGQVLVVHDMLGLSLTGGRAPKFVKNFLQGQDGIQAAMKSYVQAVKARTYPDNAVHAW